MTVALQRAQVKTIALAVSGMGNVEDRQRYSNDGADGREWMLRSGAVNACFIRSTSLEPEVLCCGEQVRRTQYNLRWWRSFNDTEASRKAAEADLQTLTDAFLAERTLNGTADNCSAYVPTITEDPVLVPMGEGEYLCDLLTLTFIAEEYVAVTYS